MLLMLSRHSAEGHNFCLPHGGMTLWRLLQFAALLFALAPLAVQAKLTKENSITLIANINQTLADFAEKSGVQIRYDDIVFHDDPMLGSYLSFKNPSLRLSYDAIYEFSARNLALKEEGEGQMQLLLPSSLTMKQFRGSQTNEFKLTLDGLPSLIFRVNESMRLNHYRIESPETVLLKMKYPAGDARAEIAYKASQIRVSEWTPIDKLNPQELANFIEQIGAAFRSEP